MTTNIFKNVSSPYVHQVTDIDTVLSRIKNGLTKTNVLKARSYGKGSPQYEEIKKTTPTFSPNGCFIGKRSTSNLISLSGFIYLDMEDNVDTLLLECTHYIYAYWQSFGGNGYGALALVENLTVENFKDVWLDIAAYFKGLGITIDPQTKDITRQNVISYDPDLWINENCKPLDASTIIPYSHSEKYYSVPSFYSTISVNYSSDITSTNFIKVKYKTTLDDYSGKTFIIIPEGKESRACYLPRTINDGKRNYWLGHFIDGILFNNPSISKKQLQSLIFKANQEHCNPSLEEFEVIQLIRWKYEMHREGTLSMKTKKQKIWVLPSLSKRHKRIIIGQQIGALRRQRTTMELREVFKNLKNHGEPVTQRLVKDHSGYSIRTIKKYWNDITEGA